MSSADANRPNLPTEMWLEVLQYLSLDDLKSLRQTCRQFYDLTDRIFYRTSELVFYGNINTTAEVISFADRECKVQNLKFVDVNLVDHIILSFFRTQGTIIRSIVFQNCKVVSGLLRNIILCCENLCSFHLEVDCKADMEPIYKDFNTLREDGIIRQHVSSFALKLETDTFVTNESFAHFFAVFPNIKELDLTCCSFEGDASAIDWPRSISSIRDQLLKMRHRLEKLRLRFNGDSFNATSWDTIATIEMENLKMLSMNWYDRWKPLVMIQAHLLEHLTEFECAIGNQLSTSVTTFVQSLLNSATKLRSLTVLRDIDSLQYPRLDKDCFQALVRSRLRTLNIDVFSKAMPDVTPSLENYLRPNYILRNLRFGSLKSDEWATLLLLFTKYFHNLETINIKDEYKSTLENIFKYQKNLCNLKVTTNNRTDYTEFLEWLTHNDELPRQFDYLTCLSMYEGSAYNVCELILTKFKFPKLKSLSIMNKDKYCSHINNDMNLFLQSLCELTELEYLEIHWEIDSTPLSLLALYRNQPKLRYLIYFNNCYVPFDKLEYYRIFKECPKLCMFMHKVDHYAYHRYVKYVNPGEKIEYAIVSAPSEYSGLDPTKQIYEGIPRKYPPFFWNKEARKPRRSITRMPIPHFLFEHHVYPTL